MRSLAVGHAASVRPLRVLYAAAALSLLAALIHLWVTPEHFEEWWGYGAFFLVAALAQMLYAPLVLVWPTRTVLLLGIGGNLAIVVLYLLTRTGGILLFGPGDRGGGGGGLRGPMRHGIGGRDRGGVGGGAVTGNHSPKAADDPALRGRRAGLGRARGASGAARLLSS